MSVTFNEEPQMARTVSSAPTGLYALVMRWGFAKDEKQALIVLLVVAAGCLVLAGIALLNGNSTTTVSPNEYTERAQSQQTVPR
jgi:hypothetical protein